MFTLRIKHNSRKKDTYLSPLQLLVYFFFIWLFVYANITQHFLLV